MKNYYVPLTLRGKHLLTLVCLMLATLGHAQSYVDAFETGKYYRIRHGNTNSSAQASPYIYDNNGTLAYTTYSESSDAQQWSVTAVSGSEGYYYVQNKGTGKYLQPISSNETTVTTTATQTSVYLLKNTHITGSSENWFNILSDAESKVSYNYRTDNTVKGWYPNDNTSYPDFSSYTRTASSGSEWGFEEVLSEEMTTPVAGTTLFKIYSHNSNFSNYVLDVSGSYLVHAANDADSWTQYWQLIDQGNGTTALYNPYTKVYIGASGSMNAKYPLVSTPFGFTISKNTSNSAGTFYDIAENDSYGLNATDQYKNISKGKNVVSWSMLNASGNINSGWTFRLQSVTLDDVNNKLKAETDAENAVRDAAQAAAGETKPVCGDTYYTIWNKHASWSTNVLAESDNRLTHISGDADDLSKYWQLVEVDGKTALRNAYTGHYIQHASEKNVAYTMGTTAYGFTISANEHNTTTWIYDLRDNDSYGLNATNKTQSISSGNNVYSWSFYDGSNDLNSAWAFKSVTLTTDQLSQIEAHKAEVAKQDQLKASLSNGIIRIKTRRSNGYYITDTQYTSGTTCHLQADKNGSDDYWQQVWIAEKNGNGYTLRNLASGKYLSPSSTSSTATAYYFYFNADNSSSESYINISKNSTQEGNGIHYQQADNLVVEWSMTAGEGSDWLIEDVSDAITVDQVKTQFAEMDNLVTSPQANTYYIIKNLSNDNVIEEDINSHVGSVNSRDTENYAQLWRLVPVEGQDGYYNLQNALTGNYIQYATFNARHSIASEATSGGFKLATVTSDDLKFHSYFAFLTGNNQAGTAYSLHRSSERLLTWTSYTQSNGITGSVWYIQKSDVTDDAITAAQSAYTTLAGEVSHADTYAANIGTFFSDENCTVIAPAYASYTDDQLKLAMSAAGITSEVLQGMAVKVKNNSWATWEKTFRTQDVQPHSNPSTWHNSLKTSNIYTTIPNPTGIVVGTNNLAYIIVGGEIPEGCSMNVHCVSQTDSQGSETALKQGLNIIPVSKTGALFINYIVPTTMSDDSKLLSDFATIPIHIEGGTVNGYIDLNREEIGTNAAWQQMKSDGLLTHTFMQMKGKYVMMNMTTSYVKNLVGDNEMAEIVGFWDWVTKTEQDLMGVSQYRDRWNDMMGCYSCTYNYMFATSYGTYFNESTLSTILNYTTMKNSGGALWGPAHEMGHNHQALINVIGTTEISNNLFSEVVVHLNGKTSTRNGGKGITDLANHYAAGDTWIDLQPDNWIPTRMFYQLYLYYEQQGYHPGFWADVFTKLRSDGINKSGSASNPCPATNDFLKLALTCCEVAGEDLSEFFEAYCMFVPFETREVGDYGTYYIYNTQEMIDEVKAKMHQYAKPSGNILFIEDHIKHEPAIDHDGNPTGELRGDYNSEDAVGKLGDVGSYSDYTSGLYASGYTYTLTDGTITMSSTSGTAAESGAVGYKVYDSEGNLLYFSNKNSFSLPESVLTLLGDNDPVVKVAQADGTDVVLPSPSATTYELKVYRADATATDKSQTVYTDGTDETLPAISGNELVYIQTSGNTLPTSLIQNINYVNAANNTAYNVELTDKVDFYAPSSFTAETLHYTRSNTAGWNTVCLPFDVTPADFGDGSTVEQYSNVADESGITFACFTPVEGTLAAGTPCLVYCPDDVTSWNITKTSVSISAGDPETIIDEDRQKALNEALQSAYTTAKATLDATTVLTPYATAGTVTNQDELFLDNAGYLVSATGDESTSHWYTNSKSDEGSYEALVDGKFNTFFHTRWEGGSIGTPSLTNNHYLVATLDEPVSAPGVMIKVAKRDIGNDYPTKFEFYGSNDFDKENPDAATWTDLGECEIDWNLGTGFTSKGVGTAAAPIAEGQTYKYIKLAATGTIYNESNAITNRGYWTIAECNIWQADAYDYLYTPTSEYTDLTQAVVDELAAQISASLAQIESGKATQTQVDALNAALENYNNCLPDDFTLNAAASSPAKTSAGLMTASANADYTFTGSYLNKTIGAGKYKLNGSGTYFGVTTAKGLIMPFRAYFSPTSTSAAANRLYVRHIQFPSTDIQTATDTDATTAPAVYDLQGRRVKAPTRGGVYIVNGQKVIF